MLADANKPQGLALLCDTYLQTSRDRLAENFSRLEKAKPGRRTSQAIHALGEETHNRERGCLVCDIIEDRTVRYLYTVVALWNSDTQFREELGQGKGFCLYHFNRLLSMAEMALESDQCNIFVRELAKIEQDNLARIQQDVYWMTQKYKSENRDKPWNGCEDAHKRTVSKIVGSCRSLDPTEKQK
ncbi:MAG: DUF6062 family protein [Spirochaetia bacterium]|jgi:hypothetical protein|nr:DUF6062 family protein [Spirochaetia bacterium]